MRVRLDPAEAGLLVSLADEVLLLLQPPDDAPHDALEDLVGLSDRPVEAPQDPVVQRLLPDAYRDDDAAAAEFRRLTDADLRGQKAQALQRITTDLSEVDTAAATTVALDATAVEVWLHGLNDIRLALGTRLDVSEDLDEQRESMSPSDPAYGRLAIYDWLTWLQESLVQTALR